MTFAHDFKTRVQLGALTLLIAPLVLEAFGNYGSVLRHSLNPYVLDEVSRQEMRLEELRKALPLRGIVGYVTDATEEEERTMRHYMTQYALAPVIVVRGTAQTLVVGDFSSGSTPSDVRDNLAVLTDFGSGVILFRRTDR